jgi:DNA-binding SARP family transcriptional activator
MTTAAQWDMLLLDGFHLSCAGASVMVKARKGVALLAFLALQRDRSADRETLAALLWEDADRAQARVSLRQLLSALRKLHPAAGPLVEADGEYIRLSPDVAVDVARFETMIEGTAAARMTACELYRSDLLASFHLRDAPAFHDWLVVEQTRLRNNFVAMLVEVMEDAERNEAGGTRGMSAALRLLRIDPYNEIGHRSLMRIYARQGRSALAIHQYRSLTALLRRELQITPEASTIALYDDLVRRRRHASAGPGFTARAA